MATFRIVTETIYTIDAETAQEAFDLYMGADAREASEWHIESGDIVVYDRNGDRCEVAS